MVKRVEYTGKNMKDIEAGSRPFPQKLLIVYIYTENNTTMRPTHRHITFTESVKAK